MFDPILQREVTSDEYFTPAYLIKQHLTSLDINGKFLDNCCGTGNWLFEILELKILNGISHQDALKNLYGVELQKDSLIICKNRLLKGCEKFRSIVENNIVCADALEYDYSFDGTWEQTKIINAGGGHLFE